MPNNCILQSPEHLEALIGYLLANSWQIKVLQSIDQLIKLHRYYHPDYQLKLLKYNRLRFVDLLALINELNLVNLFETIFQECRDNFKDRILCIISEEHFSNLLRMFLKNSDYISQQDLIDILSCFNQPNSLYPKLSRDYLQVLHQCDLRIKINNKRVVENSDSIYFVIPYPKIEIEFQSSTYLLISYWNRFSFSSEQLAYLLITGSIEMSQYWIHIFYENQRINELLMILESFPLVPNKLLKYSLMNYRILVDPKIALVVTQRDPNYYHMVLKQITEIHMDCDSWSPMLFDTYLGLYKLGYNFELNGTNYLLEQVREYISHLIYPYSSTFFRSMICDNIQEVIEMLINFGADSKMIDPEDIATLRTYQSNHDSLLKFLLV